MLGIQQYLTMFGATVSVPLLLGPGMGMTPLQIGVLIYSVMLCSGVATPSAFWAACSSATCDSLAAAIRVLRFARPSSADFFRASALANAVFTDNGDGTGIFDFNPDFTQAGLYNVTFIASDGALADTEIVAITVNQVNLPPAVQNLIQKRPQLLRLLRDRKSVV